MYLHLEAKEEVEKQWEKISKRDGTMEDSMVSKGKLNNLESIW